MVFEDRGLSISVKRYEDCHLELATNLCDVLSVGTTIGEYHSRAATTAELRAVCEKHSTWIRATLPELRAALGRSGPPILLGTS